jgi:hypothetical protein
LQPQDEHFEIKVRFRIMTTLVGAQRDLQKERGEHKELPALLLSARAVLFPFFLSRSIILGIFVMASFFSFPPASPVGSRSIAWSHEVGWRGALSNSLLPGDAVHYLDIAKNGYIHPNSRGWFPLFPIVWRLTADVTREYVITGSVLAHASFFIALVLLHRVTVLFGYTEKVAERSILYLTIFPTSHFFSVPLSESLFLALTAASFYGALANRWAMAGISGALSSATRLSGVLLLPSLAVILLFGTAKRETVRRAIPWLSIIPIGALAFFGYLYATTGDVLGYLHAQESIGSTRQIFFLQPLIQYFLHPTVFHSWSFVPLQIVMVFLGFWAGWHFIRRRQWALASYLLGSIILPLSGGLFGSATRFLMVSFPFVIALGQAGEIPRVDQTIRVVFVALLALLTLACALKFGLGMA